VLIKHDIDIVHVQKPWRYGTMDSVSDRNCKILVSHTALVLVTLIE